MTRAIPYFDAPYHPLRAFLTSRVTYLLLAGDLWLGMIQHGGRYGLGGFNVAHFAWLDWVSASAGLYVGLLAFSGFVSLSLALFSQPRWLRAVLALSYSLAWMISIHDSYQHHYFISWLLVWCAAMPEVRVSDLTAREQRVSGWGLPMTCATCAIVYAFTGLAKSEAAWRTGDVLRALATRAHEADYTSIQELLAQIGLTDDVLWTLFAYSTIALQWAISLGYVLAVRRDSQPTPWRQVAVAIGLLGALSFHLTAELFGGFEIGLFSYYMIGLALALMSPITWLMPVTVPLARGAAMVARWKAPTQAEGTRLRAALAVCMLPALGAYIPLPGAFAASWALAALVALRLLLAWRADDHAQADRLTLQSAACAFLFWLALAHSGVPFDYYRRLAGELRRMGQLEQALSAYRSAERSARWGRSRAKEIAELEREIAARPHSSEYGREGRRQLGIEP